MILYDGRFTEEAGHGHVMYGIIAFQSTGPMGKAVLFSAQFH